MTSVRAWFAPLYGTCWKRTPAVFWNFSPVRCATVPLPGDAKLTSPGLAFAAATRSASVLYGDCAGTTMTSGALATRPIGARSLTGSYGSFEYRVGLIARLLVWPSTIVYPSGDDLAT